MTKKRARKRSAAQLREEVIEGYRRLAFGENNGALRLLFSERQLSVEELAALDTFPVSNIKRTEKGGVEIKFFDRCEALLRLEAMSGAAESADGLQAFYEALQGSLESG